MGLELTLELRSERMLAGTRMVSGFTVRNGGAAAVELADIRWAAAPEPRFRLVAPDGEEQEIQRAGRGAKAAPVRELRPGESWTGDVVIRDGDAEMEPGEYKLRAALTGPDGTTVEAEAVFTVFAAVFVDVSASIAQAPDGSQALEAVLLGGGEGTRIGAAVLLRESDPKNGEMARPDLQVRGSLPGAATAIHGARANYDVSEDPLRWLVGTGPRAVYVSSNLDREAAELPMALGPLALLTPLAEAGERLVLTGVMDGAIARAVYRRGAPAPAWVKIVRTEGRAAAAAVNFWKKGTVVARAENLEKGWRLVVNEISPGGVAVAEKRYSFETGRALPGMTATAGRAGQLQLTLAVEEAGAARVWDVTLDGKLEPVTGFAKSGECPPGAGRIHGAEVAGFEVTPGHVSRTAVLYGERGTAVLSPRGTWTVFKPEVRAPLALIPGRDFWYAVRLVAGRMEVINI